MVFWEVWRRKVAGGKWSLGSRTGDNTCPSKNGRKVGPPKSYSQPSNLTTLTEHTSSQSSLESLGPSTAVDPLLTLPSNTLEVEDDIPIKSQPGPLVSNSVKKKKKKRGLKHSLSSLFPFSSTSTVAPSPVGLGKSEPSVGKEVAFVSNFRWDLPAYKQEDNLENDVIICEDDISDVDDEVEPFQCEVCDRAFLTPTRLVAHKNRQRHYACVECDSVVPTQEILKGHQEKMCQYDYVSEHEELNNFLDLGSDPLSQEDEEHEQLLDKLTLCTPRSTATFQ